MKAFLYLISIFWLLPIGITAFLYPLKIKQFYIRLLAAISFLKAIFLSYARILS